jgi:hypothetical protein
MVSHMGRRLQMKGRAVGSDEEYASGSPSDSAPWKGCPGTTLVENLGGSVLPSREKKW